MYILVGFPINISKKNNFHSKIHKNIIPKRFHIGY